MVALYVNNIYYYLKKVATMKSFVALHASMLPDLGLGLHEAHTRRCIVHLWVWAKFTCDPESHTLPRPGKHVLGCLDVVGWAKKIEVKCPGLQIALGCSQNNGWLPPSQYCLEPAVLNFLCTCTPHNFTREGDTKIHISLLCGCREHYAACAPFCG